VGSESPRRKVLIIEDEPSIRNVLYTLLAGIGCDAETATSGAQALAMVERQKFDALLLDLRCSDLDPEVVLNTVQRIRPSLIGRVLVVAGEVADEKALDMIERNFLVHVRRDKLEEVKGVMRAMLTLAPCPKPPSQ
jgi:two-component system, OmpR family, response regulator